MCNPFFPTPIIALPDKRVNILPSVGAVNPNPIPPASVDALIAWSKASSAANLSAKLVLLDIGSTIAGIIPQPTFLAQLVAEADFAAKPLVAQGNTLDAKVPDNATSNGVIPVAVSNNAFPTELSIPLSSIQGNFHSYESEKTVL